MGELAMQYGYYSAEWNVNGFGGVEMVMGEGGEALTVIDTNEAWMFHITPDPTGTSAIWVAQLVPEGHFTIVANTFVIREVIEHTNNLGNNDPNAQFLYSSNLFDVAESLGWWSRKENKPLNFLKVYSPERYRPNYSNRRVWRVFSKFGDPEIVKNLPIDTNGYADDYPFSIPVNPNKKITARDLMDIQRDHFEGTKFDLTKGLAAGPYGDPNRYDLATVDNMTIFDLLQGEYPRAMSLFRTSQSFVATARSNIPRELALLWFTQYAPDISTYTPLYLQSTSAPPSWIRGDFRLYSNKSSWWNFCVIGNYVAKFYKYAIVTVRQLQSDLTTMLIDSTKEFENEITKELLIENDKNKIISKITNFTIAHGEYVSEEYKNLFPLLLTKYRDGMVMSGLLSDTLTITKLFYPKSWLKATGYFEIPPNNDSNVILFQPNPMIHDNINNNNINNNGISYFTFFIFILIFSCVSFCMGWYSNIYKNYNYSINSFRYGYAPISGKDAIDEYELPFTGTYRTNK